MRDLLAGLILVTATTRGALARADEFRWESVGVRSGFSSADSTDGFAQAEAFSVWNLPWSWRSGSDWELLTRMDLSLGWITARGEQGFVGTVGPAVAFGRRGFPVSIEAGCSPTLLGRHRYPEIDFGMNFQFTSHAGIGWDIGRHFRLGYRWQHMSNAGLSKSNPGLNLHLFSASYRF